MLDQNHANDKQQSTASTMKYAELLEKSIGSNRDTASLGIMAAGPFRIGYVDAINGDDGREHPEFVATKHELKQLAFYWAQERLEEDFDYFVCQQSGSSEWRWSLYITRRLNRLFDILGDEAMREVRNTVTANFRKSTPSLTDEDWRIFTAGSDEEQDAWRDKLFADLEQRRTR